MRINHNISAMITQGSLFKVDRDMSKSLERLSTGLRVNRSSDDAAGLAISEKLRTQVRGTAQAQRNAQDGIAALQIAEGAANEVSDILQRMRELAIESSNDTLTSVERGYTNQEFQALNDEIERISDVTNYNGMKLLSGSGENRFGNDVAAVGTASVLWVDANSVYGTDSISVTIDTLSNASGVGSGIGTVDLMLTTVSNSVNAISTLDSAIGSVNTLRAHIGALVNRLEHAVNNLLVSETNQQAAESTIRDADFATETTKFTRNQILMQSATAMLSQANMASSGVLSLLSRA
jgi:flagellin